MLADPKDKHFPRKVLSYSRLFRRWEARMFFQGNEGHFYSSSAFNKTVKSFHLEPKTKPLGPDLCLSKLWVHHCHTSSLLRSVSFLSWKEALMKPISLNTEVYMWLVSVYFHEISVYRQRRNGWRGRWKMGEGREREKRRETKLWSIINEKI